MEHHSVTIIGAGPAGLAAAYWLQQNKIDFVLLEKNKVGWSWRNHYDNLQLHTLKAVSALPGLPMPDAYPAFPAREQVTRYLIDYAQHFGFDVREETAVTGLTFDKTQQRWIATTSQQPFSSQRVVVATGIWATPHRPTFAGEKKFEGRIIHSQAYKNAAPFAGQRVLVVGGGNTGTEVAVEVSQVAQDTTIAIRGGTTFVPYPTSVSGVRTAAWLFRHLPAPLGHALLKRSRPDFTHLDIEPPPGYLTDAYPVVGFELPEAVERGEIEVISAGIERFTERGVVFANGRSAPVDSVILATGYRPTLDFMQAWVELDDKGWPRLTKNWQSTCHPHIYCLGFTYPNTEGWLQAIPRFSKEAIAHLSAHLNVSERTLYSDVSIIS